MVLWSTRVPPELLALPILASPDQIQPLSGATITRYLELLSAIPSLLYVSSRTTSLQAVTTLSQGSGMVETSGVARERPKLNSILLSAGSPEIVVSSLHLGLTSVSI